MQNNTCKGMLETKKVSIIALEKRELIPNCSENWSNKRKASCIG